MTARRVEIVLLCEDTQQEVFARQFLIGMGWKKSDLRVKKGPRSAGSAEQWVRKNFPIELKLYRKWKQRSALIAIIDADKKDVDVKDRLKEFESECDSRQIPFRSGEEAVAIAVPKRNIETWIHYLNEGQANENAPKTYNKLERASGCQPAVNELIKLCKGKGLPENAPASLKAACEDYNLRIKPKKK